MSDLRSKLQASGTLVVPMNIVCIFVEMLFGA